jgi:hypothetical protein
VQFSPKALSIPWVSTTKMALRHVLPEHTKRSLCGVFGLPDPPMHHCAGPVGEPATPSSASYQMEEANKLAKAERAKVIEHRPEDEV